MRSFSHKSLQHSNAFIGFTRLGTVGKTDTNSPQPKEIIMKKELFSAIALSALLASPAAQAADEGKAEREKCYGVAKAGKADCAAKDGSHSCAGQNKKDADPNSWIFLPKGVCDKLAGGVKG
jgi:uncharacterized membrane protein